jgi:hypothetical protein
MFCLAPSKERYEYWDDYEYWNDKDSDNMARCVKAGWVIQSALLGIKAGSFIYKQNNNLTYAIAGGLATSVAVPACLVASGYLLFDMASQTSEDFGGKPYTCKKVLKSVDGILSVASIAVGALVAVGAFTYSKDKDILLAMSAMATGAIVAPVTFVGLYCAGMFAGLGSMIYCLPGAFSYVLYHKLAKFRAKKKVVDSQAFVRK